jgi:hypothetical protein
MSATALAIMLSLVSGSGLAVGTGLIKLSNTVSRLDASLDSMQDRLQNVESTLNRIAPPTVR